MNRILKNIVYHAPWLLSDKRFLKLSFELHLGYRPDLENPRSFNEKLQYLKLYDRQERYIPMVDKASAKQWAASIIGEEHIIPTIGVYDKVEQIPWEALPQQFVLKCTHDSGSIVICRDKAKMDRKQAIRTLRKGLATSYYFSQREWAYKGVTPRIICEPFMGELTDYKFFCFDGKPGFMFIATERGNDLCETKFDFYDMNFGHLPFTNGHPNALIEPSKPNGWETMKELASKLSRGIPQVRVDFYQVENRIYFGEMTFYHWSGLKPFEPREWDFKLGEYIKL